MTRRTPTAVHAATGAALCGSLAASTASTMGRVSDPRLAWAAAIALLCVGAILLMVGMVVDRTPVARTVMAVGGTVMVASLVAIVAVAASDVRVTAGVAALLGAPLVAGGFLALAGIATEHH